MKQREWKHKILITVTAALLFFAVTMPFRRLFQVVSVTEVRPASAFNPLFGLLYGFPGALGCAVANAAADILSGYSPLMCLLGFLVQMFYGIFPYVIWKHLKREKRLNTAKNVFYFMVIMLFDDLLTALLLGAIMNVFHIYRIISTTTLMLFLNNFVFCMVLGIPLLLIYSGRQTQKAGKKLSLNERVIMLLLLLAIVSAAGIGIGVYHEVKGYITDMLELMNRVYIYIAVVFFLYSIVIILVLRYVERNITIPLEKLSDIASEYIKAETEGKLNTVEMAAKCSQYIKVHGEAGALAGAFHDMSVNLGDYINNLEKVTAEKERIGTELNVARQIQADMLPNIFPAFPDRTEFDIYASMTPAKEVGGDFYDFFMIDNDHLALVIADVSGKGVPASLFMVISKTLLKNEMLTGHSPKDVLTKVNKQLCENNKAEMFVTVWLGILELSTGKLTAANAGHEYPAIRRSNGKYELYRDNHDFVLAAMEEIRYHEYELYLSVGDTLFLYTDGVAEATDSHLQLYGTDRMVDALNQSAEADPGRLIEMIQQDIHQFVGEAEQFDDITMLALTINAGIKVPQCG